MMKNLIKEIWDCDVFRFVLILVASTVVFGLGLELSWAGQYTPIVNEIGNILMMIGSIGFILTILINGEEPKKNEIVYVVIVEDEEEL